MVREINTVAKIIQIGNSIGITISKDVKTILKLKKDDYVEVSIKKIDMPSENENSENNA